MAVCLGAIPFSLAASADHPISHTTIDIESIVRQSARVTEADQQAGPEYEYSETDRDGDHSYKTYAVHMLYGSPYEELISANGVPLSADEQQQERRKLQEEIARRQQESPGARARRIDEYQKEQTRDRHFVQDFVSAFNFKLIGEQQFEHRTVYVVAAVPRHGFHAPDRDSEVLTGMRGELWIDTKTDQWVKAEAEVTHPVSIAGFLAKVEPGTHFVLEKMPVGENVWLPRHFTMSAKANILFVIRHRKAQDQTFFDYHKAEQPTS